MTETTVWRQVKTSAALSAYRDTAQRCSPGCVFMYGVRRNAWHSTAVSYWHFGTAYFPDRRLVQAAAESARRPGSHLWYVELPAIALTHGNMSLVAIQPASDSPFSDYEEQDSEDSSLGAIADALRRGSAGVEIWEQSPPQNIWKDSYKNYDSTSHGADFNLSWRAIGKTYQTQDFSRLIQGINEALRAGA
jgi:hypothetical protein